jgi:hypothetical protein
MSILKQVLQEMVFDTGGASIEHSPTTGGYWSNLKWVMSRSGVGMPELGLFGGPTGSSKADAYRAVFIKYSDGLDPSIQFSRTGVHNPDRGSSTVRFGTNSKDFTTPAEINPYLRSIGLPELSNSELEYITNDVERFHIPVQYEHSTRGTTVAFPKEFFTAIKAGSEDSQSFVFAATRAMKKKLDFIPARPSPTISTALAKLFTEI